MKSRIYTLDALKFFAAILIVFHHYQQSTGIKFEGINFYGGKFNFGYIVELFFILSGFFMGMSIEKNIEQPFGDFFAKRAKRLLPMAILSVLAYCILFWIYEGIFHQCWGGVESIGIWRAFSSICMMNNGGALKASFGANNPVWYIDVLLICYIVYWLILWLAKKIKTSPYYMFGFIVLLGIGIVEYDISLPFLNKITARGYYSFFWGIVLYKLIEKYKYNRYIKSCAVIVLAAIVAIVIWASDVIVIDNVVMACVFLIYPAVIILCLKSKWICKIFNHRFFGELGLISYEIYLWHVPFFLFADLITKIMNIEIKPSLVMMMIFTLIIFCIAVVAHYMLETRFTKLFRCL